MPKQIIKKTQVGGARPGAGAKPGHPGWGGRKKDPNTEKLKPIAIKESLVDRFQDMRQKEKLLNSQFMEKLLDTYQDKV